MRRQRPEPKYTQAAKDAVNMALGFEFPTEFPGDEGWLDRAMAWYEPWDLPTLKAETESVKQTLLNVNPDGGMAWGIYHEMIAVAAAREHMANESVT